MTMDSIGVPKTRTLYFSRVPASCNATAQFKAVWPPKVQKMPSGFSYLMPSSTKVGVTGKK